MFVNNVNGNCTISNENCSISNDVIDSDTSIQCHTKNQAHVFDDKNLNFAHVNIVTLPGKIDQVCYLLDNHSIDIMGFAETCLDESIPDNDVEIENYTLYRKDRNRNGGGVAAYVKQSSGLISKIRNDLMCNELELLTLEIKHTNCKPIIVIKIQQELLKLHSHLLIIFILQMLIKLCQVE